MKIQIICKGNREEGLGHLFRSASFAQYVTENSDHKLELLALAPPDHDRIFSTVGEYTRVIDNESLLPQLVERFKADMVVFDTIHMSNQIFSDIREIAPCIASISPVFNQMQHIDVYASRVPPPNAGPDTHVYAGLEYTIFNSECRPISDRTYRNNLAEGPLQTAICMGGADSFNKTLHILSSLARAQEPGLFWVLLGDSYEHDTEELLSAVKFAPQHEVIIARTNRSLWRIMRNCSLMVVPGGLTFIESIYAGLPSISLFENEWHRDALSNLLDSGASIDLGGVNVASLQKLPRIFDRLSRNRDELLKIRKSCEGLIDGDGCARVLSVLEHAQNGNFASSIRKAAAS